LYAGCACRAPAPVPRGARTPGPDAGGARLRRAYRFAAGPGTAGIGKPAGGDEQLDVAPGRGPESGPRRPPPRRTVWPLPLRGRQLLLASHAPRRVCRSYEADGPDPGPLPRPVSRPGEPVAGPVAPGPVAGPALAPRRRAVGRPVGDRGASGTDHLGHARPGTRSSSAHALAGDAAGCKSVPPGGGTLAAGRGAGGGDRRNASVCRPPGRLNPNQPIRPATHCPAPCPPTSRPIAATSSAGENGFCRNGSSGSSRPRYRISSLVYPLMNSTGTSGQRFRSCCVSSRPPIPGITTSVTTATTSPPARSRTSSAALPSAAGSTR